MSTPADVLASGILPDPQGLVEQNQSRFTGDDQLYAMFHVEAVLNEHKSNKENRMVFEDRLFVRILVPGDKRSIIDRQATPEDKRRFAEQLKKFEENQNQEASGTPLKTVPWLTPAQVEEYKFFNVFTLEQLANMADGEGQKFMQFAEHKRRAKAFMEGLVPENVQKELDERDAALAEQADKIAALEAKLADLIEED